MLLVSFRLKSRSTCHVNLTGWHRAACLVVCSVGVLVLEEEDEKGLDLGMASIYITVIAWTMVGIGALYFLMVSAACVRLRFVSFILVLQTLKNVFLLEHGTS